MDVNKRIDELVRELNKASEAYYNSKDEIMTNFEWDKKFDELSSLEEQTGYIRSDSPTRTTGSQTNGFDENREPHEYPALSLAKTKSIEKLQNWAGDRPVWMSWKLDGITLVLTYDNGVLSKILTRGDGQTGTNITFMKESIGNIPLQIEEKGHFVVRGEAAISYPDFDYINSTMEVEKYANPRNLTAGTLGLDVKRLDEVKKRRVHFYAFTLVHCDHPILSWGNRMDYLKKLGFDVVDHEKLTASQIKDAVERFTGRVEDGKMPIPVDGLVICYDDTAYAATGSVTGHHASNAGLAFKWQDETAETTLSRIEWSCAASTISPIAVFEPVQLEGTTVSRASLCNISEMKRLGIGENNKTVLEIIKANKIIPKCISVKKAEGTFTIPNCCPVCGADTKIRIAEKSGTETLHCTNSECVAKYVKKFVRFVSKTGLDIEGLSVETIIKFMNRNILTDFSSLFHMDRYKEEILDMEGFGEKSYTNLIQAANKSKETDPVSLIYALCIPMIGTDAAKKIINEIGFDGFLRRLEEKKEFNDIDGIGPEKSKALLDWYKNDKNRREIQDLTEELHIEHTSGKTGNSGYLKGLTFVITGKLYSFENRRELKQYIEFQGGKVTDSVSSKTDYLVNNDTLSSSAKNRKAGELGIPVISEEEFIRRWTDKISD